MEKKLTKEEFFLKNNFKKEVIVREYDTSALKTKGRGLDLRCSLDAMIAFCNKAKRELEGKKNIEFYQNWTDYEECSIELDYDDIETDKEFNERINKEYDKYLIEYDFRTRKERELEYQKKLSELNKLYGK